MAKKRTKKVAALKGKKVSVRAAGEKAKKKTAKGPKVSAEKATKKKSPKEGKKSNKQKEVIDVTALVAAQPGLATVMDAPDSLTHWFTVYLKTMVDPDSNTFRAKRDDIQRFLGFFHDKHRSFQCDKWTPSITKAYILSLIHI